MNREDIIKLAQEAGAELAELPRGDAWLFTDDECLERFAALVASAEREACTKVCESLWRIDGQFTADEFAAEVRARGQA